MRDFAKQKHQIAAIVLLLCVVSLLGGCALFSQPANLTPQEKRTMQIAAVEETFTNSLKAANDLYELDHVLTKQQLGSLKPLVETTQTAIRLTKVANSTGDLTSYNGQLKLARDGLDQLQAWLQENAKTH